MRPAPRGPTTTRCPSRLVPVEPGEAVLVEFGRRQALGIVLGPSTGVTGIELKPMLARVRADGPLLPPFDARLRALDLGGVPGSARGRRCARCCRPGCSSGSSWWPNGCLPAVRSGPASADGGRNSGPPRSRSVTGSRAARWPCGTWKAARDAPSCCGELRAMASRGLVSLEWTLTAATAGPRFERWLLLTEEGRRAARGRRSSGGRPRVCGPRQRALLAEILRGRWRGVASPRRTSAELPRIGNRHEPRRRGLAVVEVRERPRRPLARRRAGRRGTRPEGAALTPSAAGGALDAILAAAASATRRRCCWKA